MVRASGMNGGLAGLQRDTLDTKPAEMAREAAR